MKGDTCEMCKEFMAILSEAASWNRQYNFQMNINVRLFFRSKIEPLRTTNPEIDGTSKRTKLEIKWKILTC